MGYRDSRNFKYKAEKRSGNTICNVKHPLVCDRIYEKKQHISHFPEIFEFFGDFHAVSITTTILGSEIILDTIHVLTLNLYHPTLEV